MKLESTPIPGLTKIIPKIFNDNRGYFIEAYHIKQLRELGLVESFVQDNQSYSEQGVLRGLHFQHPPYAQGKLARVISGKVWDIVVDLRSKSPTFGQYHQCVLDSVEHHQLYVPPGMAHGFYALEPTLFIYKCTGYYHPEVESGIHWQDPDLNIDWPNKHPIVSAKDQKLPSFEELKKTLKFN